MMNAKAFVFAAEEDFGITPVEAQACGTPVIAYGKGGVLETIKPYGEDEPTGVFFNEQKVDSIISAINRFESISHFISPINCRKNAEKFSVSRFRLEIEKYVLDKYKQKFERND